MIACCVTHFIVLFFRHQPAPVSYSTLFSSIRPAQAGMCPKTLLRIASRINRRNNYNVSHFVCSFGGVATFQNSSKQLLQVVTTKRGSKTKTPGISNVRTPLSLYHFMFNKQVTNYRNLKPLQGGEASQNLKLLSLTFNKQYSNYQTLRTLLRRAGRPGLNLH